MSSRERLKRPMLERVQPVRSWSAMFGMPMPDGGASPSASPGRDRPGGSWSDVVARSVELGYRVVDEYIRQGQSAARQFGGRSFAGEKVTADAQELVGRMAQYAADFTTLWLEMMQAAAATGGWPTPSQSVRSPRPPATGAATPPAQDAPRSDPRDTPARTLVRVVVASAYPTEVSVDFHPRAGLHQLAAQALRSADDSVPRITDVHIATSGPEEPVVLRIQVPAGQPPGVYNGMIVDEETGFAAGTVSLRVLPQ